MNIDAVLDLAIALESSANVTSDGFDTRMFVAEAPLSTGHCISVAYGWGKAGEYVVRLEQNRQTLASGVGDNVADALAACRDDAGRKIEGLRAFMATTEPGDPTGVSDRQRQVLKGEQ